MTSYADTQLLQQLFLAEEKFNGACTLETDIIDLATIALAIICYGAEKASELHAECCQTRVFVWGWVLHMAGAQMLVEA
jgi:hypothetical protein